MKTPSSAKPTCPECHSPLLRERRSFVDRCLSLLVPMARYRCVDARCGWKGLLRLSEMAARVHHSGTDYRPRTVLEPARPMPRPHGERRTAR